MIKFHLNSILIELDISQNRFAHTCGVRPNTINNIVNNKVQRIELDTLNKIMSQLSIKNYEIKDLMEYTNE